MLEENEYFLNFLSIAVLIIPIIIGLCLAYIIPATLHLTGMIFILSSIIIALCFLGAECLLLLYDL